MTQRLGMTGLVVVLGLLPLAVQADAPDRSPRPVPRPGIGLAPAPLVGPDLVKPGTVDRGTADPGTVNPGNPGQAAAIPLTGMAETPVALAGLARSPVPRPRPAAGLVAIAEPAPEPEPEPAAAPQAALASTSAAAIAPKPKERRGLFGFLKANGMRTQPDPQAIVGRVGSVCGVPAIKGKALPPIAAKLRGCGIAAPVEVTSVDGIALTPSATLDCSAAVALNAWVHTAVKPAFSGKGGGLEALLVAESYDCRTRNHVPGARISEHGWGGAIDISGFILESGVEVTVSGDYRRGGYAKPLKTVHRAACGPFGTTLGPGSDGLHENHLHLDTASYRSGPYCK